MIKILQNSKIKVINKNKNILVVIKVNNSLKNIDKRTQNKNKSFLIQNNNYIKFRKIINIILINSNNYRNNNF